jgi:TatA/E family protein of Tat protein translocase
MFGSVGLPEILMILVIALLIFGPRKLPEVGRTIGRGLGEFRRASADFKRTVNVELALEEDEARPPTTRRPLPPAREEHPTPAAPPAQAATPATSPGPAGAVARGAVDPPPNAPDADPDSPEQP